MRKFSFISCLVCFALTSFMFSSCGDSVDDEEGGGGGEKMPAGTIAGVVQKGPFLKGSSVTIYSMDKELNPTGLSYPTQTTDDMGSYSVSNVDASYVEVKANGYYYNETTRKKSESSLNLQALSQSGRRVNVNLLTTLAYNRIKYLVHSGLSFADAQNRAQIEVLTALGLGNSTSANFTEMNIAGSGDANGLLLAASLLIQQGRSDVSKLISDIAEDLEEDGIISSDLNKQIHRNESSINVGTVITGLISLYEKNMVENLSIPEFYNFLDINGDGVMDGKAGDFFKCLDFMDSNSRSLSINELNFVSNVYMVSRDGFFYNRTYLSTIPFDVKSDAEWLAVEKRTIDDNIYIVKIEAKSYEGEKRTGNIEYIDNSGKVLKTITFQQGDLTQTKTTINAGAIAAAAENAVAEVLAAAQAAAPAGAVVAQTGDNEVTTTYSDNTREVTTIMISYTYEINGVSYDYVSYAEAALSKLPAGSTASIGLVLHQTTITQKYNADGTRNGSATINEKSVRSKAAKVEIPGLGNYIATANLEVPTSVNDTTKTVHGYVVVVPNHY